MKEMKLSGKNSAMFTIIGSHCGTGRIRRRWGEKWSLPKMRRWCLPLNTILKARLRRDAQELKLIQVYSVISEELKAVWLNRAVSTCLKNKS